METKTKYKLLVSAVIILFAVCAGEGIYIYRQAARNPYTVAENDFDSFSSKMKHLLNRDQKTAWGMFDQYFNNDFFSKNKDPFNEMERFHKRMNEMMENETRGSFDHSWDSWFDNRFLSSNNDVNMHTTEKDHAYVIKLDIPNLKDNHINIKIDQDGIALNGDYTQMAEKKDDDGNVISKEEVHRSLAQQFSIPPDADYQNAKIAKHPNEIVITLPKRVVG